LTPSFLRFTRTEIRAIVQSYEYEVWPRGRIVFDRARDPFVLYADRKLLTPERSRIQDASTIFAMPDMGLPKRDPV
jgi:hypothetical protein